MTQVVEKFPSKGKALSSSNTSTEKRRRRRRKEFLI
jgi:hypothetical protein